MGYILFHALKNAVQSRTLNDYADFRNHYPGNFTDWSLDIVTTVPRDQAKNNLSHKVIVCLNNKMAFLAKFGFGKIVSQADIRLTG